MDIKALYQSCIRCQWQKIAGQPYQAKALDVELNLSKPDEVENWIKVRLLFVRGAATQEKAQVGKHDWAVFLTTDISIAPQRILELYAMRWAIEVYFKEAKQYLGFLQEQSNHYAAYVASIHLTATRLWQVFHAVITGALDEIKALLGGMVAQVMKAIEQHVQSFFAQALQLDARTLRLEAI
jgi:hypothetical protein